MLSGCYQSLDADTEVQEAGHLLRQFFSVLSATLSFSRTLRMCEVVALEQSFAFVSKSCIQQHSLEHQPHGDLLVWNVNPPDPC